MVARVAHVEQGGEDLVAQVDMRGLDAALARDRRVHHELAIEAHIRIARIAARHHAPILVGAPDPLLRLPRA